MTYALIILFFLGIVHQPKPSTNFSIINQQNTTISWYEKGKKFNDRGDWKSALDVWEEGKQKLELQGLNDPRIGIAFIRLVTSKKLKDKYSKAIDNYLWGIEAIPNKVYSPFFRDEIARLRPIAGNEQTNQWINMLEKQNPQLGTNIANFWCELDPVLSTDFNERLIEHWLRIDYSRKHFTRNEDTVYDTDERGLIYVKYGKPTHIYTRKLSFDRSRAIRTAKELLEREINHSGESGIQPLDISKGSSGYVFIEDAGLYRHLAKLAEQLHGQPEVTIWIYDQLPNPRWNSTVFIFGKRHNGPFQMLTSLEQLLDGAIYQKLRYKGGRYQTPPFFLAQQQLYETVRNIAPIFGDRFSDIQQKVFIPSQKVTLLDAIDTREQSFITFNRSYLSTSKQASLFENTLPDLPMHIQQYRMLDVNSNKPYILTSVFVYPLKPAVADFLGDYSKNKSYTLSTVYQPKPLQSDTYRQHKSVNYNLANLDTNSSIVTIFKSHTDRNNQAQISSELSRPEKFTDHRGLETNIKAIQKKDITVLTPLDSGTETLEMSDVILGYSSQKDRPLIPFLVTAANIIPAEENLKLKFEVYHLKKDTTGKAGINIDYSIKPTEGFLKRLFSSKENRVSLSLNFETQQNFLSEVLEIETQKFSPDDYKLSLVVSDRNSNQTVKRTVEFAISEN